MGGFDEQAYNKIYGNGARHGYAAAAGVILEMILENESALSPEWKILDGAFKRLREREAAEIARVMGA